MAVIDDVASEFDVQRKKATQAVNANVQAKRDAISRAAARSGGGPGGAFVRVEQKAIDEGGRQLADANESINASQAAEMRRLREVDEGRKFTTSERLGSQEFSAGQADKQRTWQTGERLGGQEFTRGERLGSQEWQGGENDKSRGLQKDIALMSDTTARRGQDQQKDIFLASDATARLGLAQNASQFNQTFGLSRDQLEHEKYVDGFNMELATRIQAFNEKNPGLLGSLFGDSLNNGFLGQIGRATGLGGGATDLITGGIANPFGTAGAVAGAIGKKRRLF